MIAPFDRPGLIGRDFADELTALGHDVRFFAYRRTNVLYKNKPTKAAYQRVIARRLEREAVRFAPHIVLVHKGGPIGPEVLARVKTRTRAIVANVFPDNPLWMLDFTHIEPYDLFFAKEPYAVRQLRLVGLQNVHYLPTYVVPAAHHPVEPTIEERRALDGTVAFVGAWYPYRERFFTGIADQPLRVFGPGWKRAADPRVCARVAGGSLYGRAKLAVYCAATLSLNLHHPMNDILGVNNRTFELAGAGSCQVVDFKEDLATLFKPGEEVLTFRDVVELRRLLDHYLPRPDEARAIGENGRRRALAEHTVRHRIEEILAVVRERFGDLG